jgi:hypothetical protein
MAQVIQKSEDSVAICHPAVATTWSRGLPLPENQADPAWRSALNLDPGEGERLLVLVASHAPEAAQPS